MESNLYKVLMVLATYLLGSIPTGKVIASAHGLDIQSVGSGNTGGTNVNRFLGIRWAAIVAIADVAKVLLPVTYVYYQGWADIWVCAVALVGSLGHVFSIFLGFKGGKAVSTYLGSLLVIIPVHTIVWLLVWATILRKVKIMSVVNLIWLLTFIPVLFLLRGSVYGGWSMLMWVLIAFAHRSNIRRLIRGEELGLQKQGTKTKEE